MRLSIVAVPEALSERLTEFLPKDSDLVCAGTASLREVEGHVVKAPLEYQRPFAGTLITA